MQARFGGWNDIKEKSFGSKFSDFQLIRQALELFPRPSSALLHVFVSSCRCIMFHVAFLPLETSLRDRKFTRNGNKASSELSAERNATLTKHVLDVLIPNWASNKHQLAAPRPRRRKITNILEA
jgi:hypothetical protein